MSENDNTQQEHRDITAPPEGSAHEATTPPGQGDRDDEAIERGRERLEQAGGGH